MKTTACGILPFSYHNKDIYVLVGKDQYNPNKKSSEKYCSFGGKKEENETNEHCAAREAYEESIGLLGSTLELEEKLNEKHKDYIGCIEHLHFKCYYINVPYVEELPKMYKNVYNFILDIDVSNSETLEKSELKWVKLNTLYDIIYKKKKSDFAKEFLETMGLLMKNKKIVFSLKKIYSE